MPDGIRLYGRLGWNEGRHESFAYTEVNSAISFGGDILGKPWRRDKDRAGVALSVNGISTEHQQYLRLGGNGFLLGDGFLIRLGFLGLCGDLGYARLLLGDRPFRGGHFLVRFRLLFGSSCRFRGRA